jgi:hypothetical protein
VQHWANSRFFTDCNLVLAALLSALSRKVIQSSKLLPLKRAIRPAVFEGNGTDVITPIESVA